MKKSRNTRQRTVILDLLRKTRSHPTAEAIYREARKTLPHISLGTVYRNLNFLREQGTIREIRSSGDPSSRFDADLSPHAHFHCNHCRTVHDLPLPEALGALSFEPGGSVGTVNALDLHLVGACSHCVARVPT